MNFCSLAPLFSLLGKKWSTHILATFCKKTVISFGDLSREFPHVTSRVLSQRLREFQQFGLIQKDDDGKYRVTEFALKIADTITHIQE